MSIIRLEPDIIRDILFVVESETDLDHYAAKDDFNELFEKYGASKVAYHAKQAYESGLIEGLKLLLGSGFIVNDLTPRGHQFLSDIRNDTNWSKTKSIAKTVGNFSLNALSNIAEGVTTAAINKTLNQ
ncbi:DUF2513 domain-containing protein [Latilactobacillus curvatus]|uniref:DUF2513 domain-containing protein n=1 Tax=Latilactobacillus curvatus TaxID=28038 RepID=UPI0013DEC2E3|nr:DUF2513 domain-containing protein [Latilactobacillus curvatus]